MAGDIIGVALFYLLIGFVGMGLIDACLDNEMNPLWKMPLVLSGPLTFVIFVVMVIVHLIREYIKEVKEYYRRKNEKKRRDEERRMREYEKNLSSNRHAE